MVTNAKMLRPPCSRKISVNSTNNAPVSSSVRVPAVDNAPVVSFSWLRCSAASVRFELPMMAVELFSCRNNLPFIHKVTIVTCIH